MAGRDPQQPSEMNVTDAGLLLTAAMIFWAADLSLMLLL